MISFSAALANSDQQESVDFALSGKNAALAVIDLMKADAWICGAKFED